MVAEGWALAAATEARAPRLAAQLLKDHACKTRRGVARSIPRRRRRLAFRRRERWGQRQDNREQNWVVSKTGCASSWEGERRTTPGSLPTLPYQLNSFSQLCFTMKQRDYLESCGAMMIISG